MTMKVLATYMLMKTKKERISSTSFFDNFLLAIVPGLPLIVK